MKARIAALAAALTLGGCTIGSGTIGADAPPPASDPAVIAAMRQVASVERLEMGRTFQGIALIAFGEASGPGWTLGRLAPRGDRPGPDGFLEFDFVAAPPPADAPPTAVDNAALRRLRGHALVPLDALEGVAGIRVHAAAGSISGRF
jgi:hypothetical protein